MLCKLCSLWKLKKHLPFLPTVYLFFYFFSFGGTLMQTVVLRVVWRFYVTLLSSLDPQRPLGFY